MNLVAVEALETVLKEVILVGLRREVPVVNVLTVAGVQKMASAASEPLRQNAFCRTNYV